MKKTIPPASNNYIHLLSEAYKHGYPNHSLNSIMEVYNATDDIHFKENFLSEKKLTKRYEQQKFESDVQIYLMRKYMDKFPKYRTENTLQALIKGEYDSMLDKDDLEYAQRLKAHLISKADEELEFLNNISLALKYYIRFLKDKSYYNFGTLRYNIYAIMEFCKLVKNPEIEILYLEFIKESYSKWVKKKGDDKEMFGRLSEKKGFFKIIENEISLRKSLLGDKIKDFENKKYKIKELSFDSETEIKSKPDKKIKKLQWNVKEESVLRIIDLFYNSKFITSKSYNEIYAILRDSFLNEKGEPFNNKQLAVVRKKMDAKENIITSKDSEYTNFSKLLDELNKLISD